MRIPKLMNPEISFAPFYKKYYARMLSYCFHTFRLSEQDAEDIVSDAFTELWQQWNELDAHSEPILLSWIRTTIKYQTYSFNRKKAKAPATVELGEWIASNPSQPPDSEPISLSDGDPSNELVYRTYLEVIRSKLNPKQLQLFECIIVEQNDISTAAGLLHMKENTVKVGLKRLRAKLRKDILPQLLER